MNKKIFFYIALLGFFCNGLLGMKKGEMQKPDSVKNGEMVAFSIPDKVDEVPQHIATVFHKNKVHPTQEQTVQETIPLMRIWYCPETKRARIGFVNKSVFYGTIGELGNKETGDSYVNHLCKLEDGLHIIDVTLISKIKEERHYMVINEEFRKKAIAATEQASSSKLDSSWKMPEPLQRFVTCACALVKRNPEGATVVGGLSLIAIAWYFGILQKILGRS